MNLLTFFPRDANNREVTPFTRQPVTPAPEEHRMKILVVEDDPTTRTLMNHLISARGHQVIACGSAEEASELLDQYHFNAAILDWMLPGMSGPAFCRLVRQRPGGHDLYILLVTARNSPSDLEEALDSGANDYLVKPWESKVLLVRLRIAEQQVVEIKDRKLGRDALRESTLRSERLALVARQTQNGVVLLDPKGNIEWTNLAFEKMAVRGPASYLKRPFLELIEAAEFAQREEIERCISEGHPAEGEIVWTGNDGQKRWLHYSLTPLILDKGGSSGLVSLFSDITMLKRADEERFKSSKLESLGVLAGGIAHDLNNILTVISGNLSLARTCLTTNPTRIVEHLDKADTATLRASDLSKQLLTFAKGGDPLKQTLHLGELVERATRFALYGSNLSCVFDFSPELAKVQADPYQIEQVINNLVINAREAMPGGGKLVVGGRDELLAEENPYDLPAGAHVRISFADNGPGIPPDVMRQIFDPYFSTKETGSGLGLTLSFSIISKHGGRLLVDSVEGQGATFDMLLPAATVELPVISNLAAPAPGRRRVLCMDDEPSIRELISAMLSLSDYDVTTTSHGEEAVAVYREHLETNQPFDAVILDATIPGGMGGLDTIKALLEINPDVRAIICSGYSDESALAAMESYGFKASLPKPFSSKQLETLVARIIAIP